MDGSTSGRANLAGWRPGAAGHHPPGVPTACGGDALMLNEKAGFPL